MSEAAFLRRIIEQPNSDSARLIYADWLEEHAEMTECQRCKQGANPIYTAGVGKLRWHAGDGATGVADCPDCRGSGRVSDGRAERAEFIRVQCELARWRLPPLDHPDPAPATFRAVEHHNALRRRERELLAANWLRWVPLLPAVIASGRRDGLNQWYETEFGGCRFHRGFVAKVTLRLEDWCGRMCGCTLDGAPVSQQDCPVCPGLGRTGVLGPQLVQAAPIERVTFTDTAAWLEQGRVLPACIMCQMPEGLTPRRPRGVALHGRGVPEPEAIAILSDAALAWARQAAGLPALKREETT